MSKLIVTDSSGINSEFVLSRERTTIGRHANNDIVLNDKAVSGKHAAIVTVGEDLILEDLKSTNGTQVNGEAITRYPLMHGDVISLGRVSIKYLSQEEPDAGLDRTQVLRPGQSGAPPEAGNARISPAFDQTVADMGLGSVAIGAGKPLLGKLRVSSGSNQGKEMELTKALTTIGKPGVQVAAITRRADGYYIVHVGGGSGPRRPIVNGVEIDTQARKLADRDRIELAGTAMEFVLLPG